MYSQAKISAVITTYNRKELLKKAIESVINQTYENVEIIVVDDASNCDNQEVIDFFKHNKLNYFRFETNQGGNVCRNKGIELANGEYIAFLDDDDIWLSEKLEKQIEFMIQNKLDFSYTGKNIIKVNDQLHEISKKYSFKKAKYSNLRKSIMKRNFIGTTSSVMFKKSSLVFVNNFDIKMPMMQDYELYIRSIFKNLSVQGIDLPLLNYHIYVSSNSVGRNFTKFYNARSIMLKKFENFDYITLLKITLFKDYFKRNVKLALYKLDQWRSK